MNEVRPHEGRPDPLPLHFSTYAVSMLKLNLVSLSLFGVALITGCGSSTNTFDDSPTDGSVDETSGGDTSGGGGDTNGGTDTIGTDTTTPPTDTTPPPTDSTPPPTDTASCPGTVCSGICTDTRTDAKNCGTCGTAVCHDEVCNGGKPACAPRFRACGAGTGCLGCVSPTDPNNCGACGVKCTASQVCVPTTSGPGAGGAKCVDGSTCAAGMTNCSGSCTFTSVDISNCGACGKVCSPGQFCTGGVCTTYTPAPGCTTCPCVTCAVGTTCCRYSDGVVCSAGKCAG